MAMPLEDGIGPPRTPRGRLPPRRGSPLCGGGSSAVFFGESAKVPAGEKWTESFWVRASGL
jgi:hypothetical protein